MQITAKATLHVFNDQHSSHNSLITVLRIDKFLVFQSKSHIKLKYFQTSLKARVTRHCHSLAEACPLRAWYCPSFPTIRSTISRDQIRERAPYYTCTARQYENNNRNTRRNRSAKQNFGRAHLNDR